MSKDIFLPLYFSGLYPAGDDDKINLFSSAFFRDAFEFYKKFESKRKNVLLGIRYLSNSITDSDDLSYVILNWEREKPVIVIHSIFESVKQKPNFVTDFMNEVDAMLYPLREKLIDKRTNELKRLREKSKRDSGIIDGLILNKNANDQVNQPTVLESTLTNEQVSDLYSKMQEYIVAEPAHFGAMFKSKALPQAFSIKWKGTGRLLGYFIEELVRLKFIRKDTPINKVIKEYFIDKNNNPFKDSIRQNRSGSGDNKNSKPKGYNDINAILKSI